MLSLGWGYFAGLVLNLKNAQLMLNKATVIRLRKPMADFTTFRAVNFLSFLAIPLRRQPWKWLPIHQSNRYSSHNRKRLHYIKSPMYLIPIFH